MEITKVNTEPISLKKTIYTVFFLTVILILFSFLSLGTGSVHVPFDKILKILFNIPVEENYSLIILKLRIPRILLAILVGGGLSLAGVVFQALLRNPLAEPYILGISSGGTFGAVVAISSGFAYSLFTVPISAFMGAVLVMFVVYIIAEKHGRLHSTTLLLTGIIIGAFFNAMILLLMVIKHKETREAFLWLVGNISGASIEKISIIAPVIIVSLAIIYTKAKYYNLLAIGEETAKSLGLEVEKFKKFSYITASLITAMLVSFSGIIGFVGLIIPHLCRLIWGADHRILIPVSFLIGAGFLIIVDMLSRIILAPLEIPIGAITALIGAPIFLLLLLKRQRL